MKVTNCEKKSLNPAKNIFLFNDRKKKQLRKVNLEFKAKSQNCEI